MILNIEYLGFYAFHMGLLFILFLMAMNKNTSYYVFACGAVIISSIYLILYLNINILSVLYYISLGITICSNTKYVFNRYNNKMGLVFKKIEFPDKEEFLTVKYMSGPIKVSNANGIIVKKENSLVLKLETDEVKEIILSFKDINNIDIQERPYIKVGKSFTYDINENTSLKNSNNTSWTSYKSQKLIKSYNITIKTNNEVINLISFDKPLILEELKN